MSKKLEKKSRIKRQKTFELCLTKLELLHVRDLLSVLLPPEGEETLSSNLAKLEDREFVEAGLWRKVSELCTEANLPLGSEAPDYVIAPISAPSLSVFHVNHDVEDEEDDEEDEASEEGFLPKEDDSSDDEDDEEE